MFKISYGNTRKMCEICSELTLKIPEQRQLCRSGVFIDNFEHMSHLFVVILFLVLNKYPAANYILKVNNRNTRTRCEICSKLTIKTPE